MSERTLGDPRNEGMNNFHCHMPGGSYRPDADHGKHYLPAAMRRYLEEFEPFMDNEEDKWPKDCDHELIRAVRTKRDIQRQIDTILKENPELAERWECARPESYNGMNRKLREYVLRPVYVLLRENFTEEDLSS